MSGKPVSRSIGRKRSRKEMSAGAKEQGRKRSAEPEEDALPLSDGTESDDYSHAKDKGAQYGASEAYADDSSDSDSEEEDIPLGPNQGNTEASHSMFDFNFYDPAPIDFHSVKRLLVDYIPGESDAFDSSKMSDAIVAQPEVGTTVKVPGDDDVYSLATVLDLEENCKDRYVQQILHFIRKKSLTAGKSARLLLRTAERFLRLASAGSGALSASAKSVGSDSESDEDSGASSKRGDRHGFGRVGLLVSERIINMPAELAPTLLKSLSDDLEWSYLHQPDSDGSNLTGKSASSKAAASSNSSSKGLPKQPPPRYTHFVASFRCFKDKSAMSAAAAAESSSFGHSASSAPSASSAAAAGPEGDVPGHPGVHHLHFDEAHLCSHAIASVLVPAKGKKRKPDAADDGQGPAAQASSSSSSASATGDAERIASEAPSVTTGADKPSSIVEFRRIVLIPANALPEAAAAATAELEEAARAAGEVPISVVDLIANPDAVEESQAGGLTATQPAQVVKPGKRKSQKKKGSKKAAARDQSGAAAAGAGDTKGSKGKSKGGGKKDGPPKKKKRKKLGGGMSIVPI